jgi:hypothetical protein
MDKSNAFYLSLINSKSCETWAQRKASPHGSCAEDIYIHEGAKHISQLTKNSAIS